MKWWIPFFIKNGLYLNFGDTKIFCLAFPLLFLGDIGGIRERRLYEFWLGTKFIDTEIKDEVNGL